MVLKLYSVDASPPCRAVLLTAKALGLTLDIQDVNVRQGDHLKPEYLKMNPQHTLPTLDDDGFIVWDSHAINAYLVEQYGKDDSLYPKDKKRRALVDQRLHFDTGNAFTVVLKIGKPIRLGLTKEISDDKKAEAQEVYSFLEAFLNGNEWIVPGEGVTIADFSLIATITSLDVVVPIESERFPNVKEWIKRCRDLPYYDANEKGLESFKALFDMLMNQA